MPLVPAAVTIYVVQAYVGFTSATGRSWAKHDVLAWYWCHNDGGGLQEGTYVRGDDTILPSRHVNPKYLRLSAAPPSSTEFKQAGLSSAPKDLGLEARLNPEVTSQTAEYAQDTVRVNLDGRLEAIEYHCYNQCDVKGTSSYGHHGSMSWWYVTLS